MQDIATRLFLKHDDDSVFNDFSDAGQDFSRDDTFLPFTIADDFLYIGFRKAINSIYIEPTALSTVADNKVTIDYFKDDGVSPGFVAVDDLLDETQGFLRPGFVTWNRNQDEEAKTTINLQEAIWYRFNFSLEPEKDISLTAGTSNTSTVINIADADVSKVSVGQKIKIKDSTVHFATITIVDPSTGTANFTFTPAAGGAVSDNTVVVEQISIRGINTVFSDDQDLRNIVPNILVANRFLPTGQTSHVLSHVAARNFIMTELRNDGRFVLDFNTGDIKQIDIYDIHQVKHFREASKWKALSIIFEDISDEPEDLYAVKARNYDRNYNKSIRHFFDNFDFDDDGREDRAEQLTSSTATIVRR